MRCSCQPGGPLSCPEPEPCSSGPSAAGSAAAAAAAGGGQLGCSGEPGSSMPNPEGGLEEENTEVQANVWEHVKLVSVTG